MTETIGEDKGKLVTGTDSKADGLELRELTAWHRKNCDGLQPFPSWGHQLHLYTHLLGSWTNPVSITSLPSSTKRVGEIEMEKGRSAPKTMQCNESRCELPCTTWSRTSLYVVEALEREPQSCIKFNWDYPMASKLLDGRRIVLWVPEQTDRQTDMYTAHASCMLNKWNPSHLPSSFTGKTGGSDKGTGSCFPWET